MKAEIRRVLLKPVNQLDAKEFVVRAWGVLEKGESVAIANEGRSLLEEALRLDPTLAEANISMIYVLAVINEVDRRPQRERYLREAEEFSARAVAINEGSSQAWLSRAHTLLGLGRWNASLEACDRAMQLDPYFWRPYVVRAEFLIATGRPAEALPMAEKALALNPPPGMALALQCEANLLLGDAEEAIRSCERASGLSNGSGLYSNLAAAYANAGDMVQAHAALKAMLKVVPGATIAALRANRYSAHPEYQRLVEKYWYDGLRKAGLPEQ
jgi:adenylate cyclase